MAAPMPVTTVISVRAKVEAIDPSDRRPNSRTSRSRARRLRESMALAPRTTSGAQSTPRHPTGSPRPQPQIIDYSIELKRHFEKAGAGSPQDVCDEPEELPWCKPAALL